MHEDTSSHNRNGLMGSRSWISFVVAISKKQRLKESNTQTNKGHRFGILSILIRGIVLLLLLCPIVGAAAPVAQFRGTPIFGSSPLTVTFTDTSTGSPTGWALYSGDETYTAPWTQMTANAGWTARYYHSSVAMPDGSIVLMGGWALNEGVKNDTWRSTDNGATWTQQTASAGWSARSEHSSVVMPDGSIVLMGGFGGYDNDNFYKNDVWRSTDNGATWTQQTASAGWSARHYHSSVAMPDGSIVLMGGQDVSLSIKNDTWRSKDNGATWTEMTASAGWRAAPSTVAMPDSSIVVIGGGGGNDVWRSTDNGATWTQINAGTRWTQANASTVWTPRYGQSSVAMPDGSIVMVGGYDADYKNDVWRSTDNGITWRLANASAGWSARYWHSSVAMPDGSIVLMGGNTGGLKNDVWRLMPGGSLAPVANFTGVPTSGTTPLTVTFTDSSTNNPTSWAWSFGDGDTTNSTKQNPIHTYNNAGIYTIALTATNATGSETKTRTNYITISAPSTSILNPPVLVSPGTSGSPGIEIATLTPIFSWQPVAGANSYGLYIRDLTTNTLVFDSRTRGIPITGSSYTIPEGVLQNGKSYRWNMNSHSAGGWGSYSDRLYFQAPVPLTLLDPPVLVSPGTSSSPGTELSTLTPTFSWQAVPDADGYGLYISDITNGEGSADLIFNSQSRGITITGTQYPLPSNLLHNGRKYRWNMNTHNSDGWGSTNAERFYFQSPAINPALLPSPDFSVTPESPKVNEDITLDASASSNPDGEAIANYIWIIDGKKTPGTSPLCPLKFKIAGEHTISLIVSDASRHVSLPLTKTFSVSDSTNDGLTVFLPPPEKIANWQTKEFTITILNSGEEGSGKLLVKLDLPPNLYITSSIPQYYLYSKENPKRAYWIINNIAKGHTYPITFSAKYFNLNPFSTAGMRYNVSVKRVSNSFPDAFSDTFYPGINWKPASRDGGESANSRMANAYDLEATLLKSYYETNNPFSLPPSTLMVLLSLTRAPIDMQGATHVWLAYHNIFTPENYVDNPIGDGYHEVVFSHSGGTQTLYKKLESGKVTAKYAFFIAPALLEQDKLAKLIDDGKVIHIFIVQSKKDILYNTYIEFEKNHIFEHWPNPDTISPAIRIWETLIIDDQIGPAEPLGSWISAPGLIPSDILNPNSVEYSKIPENESYWIGGTNRLQQTEFHNSTNITVLNPSLSGNRGDVHTGLLNWVIEYYNNGDVYPFNDEVEFPDLHKMPLPKTQTASQIVTPCFAHDPNEKTGPEGHYPSDQPLNYTIEYENEGDGSAFGVYVTDILDPGLDESTIEISPMYSTATGQEIAEQGVYFPENRTIYWNAGDVAPGEGGFSNISVQFSASIPDDTKVINYATVFFPTAFEETQTNAIVTSKGVNLPPEVPNLTYPENDGMNLPVNGTLFWQCHDPNNETLIYDVYLGTSTPPALVIDNTSSDIYEYSGFVYEATYYWKIVAKDPYGGETESEIHQFTIKPNDIFPISNFITNITSGNQPLTVQFIDISPGSPTTWNWSFGDSIYSSDQNPVHTYRMQGIYSVTLTVTNASGSSNVTIKTNYITVYPKGDFNENWRIDIGDVTRVAYMAVNLTPPDLVADFNGNSQIDIGDASKIAWYYVGKVAEL